MTMTLSERMDIVETTRLVYGPAAAQRTWIALGLPVVPAMLESPENQATYEEVCRQRTKTVCDGGQSVN